MFVHVIVIGSSTAHILVNCIESLQDQGVDIRLSLIENINLSTNPDYDRLQSLTSQLDVTSWIRNTAPRGFSANNTTALASITEKPSFVLFLNDDTVVHPGAIRHMARVLTEDPAIGMVGPRIVGTDGCGQDSVFLYPLGSQALLHALFGKRFSIASGHADSRSVWLSAACLMVRWATLKEIGGFDERFDPGYAEDTDFCYRAIKHGWKLVQCPDAVVTHIGGMSFGAQSPARYRLSYRGLFRFVAKWASTPGEVAIRAAWVVGSIARMLLSLMRELALGQRTFSKTRLYGAILLAALSRNDA